MGASPFDPRVKATHSKLQAIILLEARYPRDLKAEQDQRVEQAAEYADALDRATDTGGDLFEEEGFEVEDEAMGEEWSRTGF